MSLPVFVLQNFHYSIIFPIKSRLRLFFCFALFRLTDFIARFCVNYLHILISVESGKEGWGYSSRM